ncbi:uncharacterized protein ACNS7B_008320 isoform 1-T1 [Menidia menidia]
MDHDIPDYMTCQNPLGQLRMKRQGGRIDSFFIKRSKSGTDQTGFSSDISSPGSSCPENSHEKESLANTNPPSPVPSKEESENTESSAPDQDDDEPEGAIAGDTTDLFSAVSSTPFAFPKGPSDISKSKEQGPVQPSLTNFPRTQHGTRKRTFHSSWYKDYSWLEYSVIKDSSYCFACRHFSLPNAPDSVFASHSGFSNWKKALSKESGFKLHSKLEHHVNAMYAWSQYKRANEGNTTMLNSINTNRKKVVEENRYYIKTIADVLLLTATQNIAQRGLNRESGDSRNKGNFLAILDEIAKHDQLIEKKA